MSTKNKTSTRYYSELQEKNVAKLLNGRVQSNSGAGLFNKSDIIVSGANLSIECKTSMSQKNSFSVKQEWIEKEKQEGFSQRLYNQAIAFNFGPESKENYFIINERLMKFLTDKLCEEYVE
jgi:hypothetical protein